MANSKRTTVVWLVVLGFVAFLAWTTLRSQKATCEVCIAFGTGRNCATASANDKAAAAEAAQATACGPLVRGMDASIACGRTPPTSASCQGG